MQLKEEKPEAVNESKLKGNRSSTGVKDTAIKTSKLGKDCTDDVSVIPESEEGNHLTNSGNRTKRQKFLPIKLRMDVSLTNSLLFPLYRYIHSDLPCGS